MESGLTYNGLLDTMKTLITIDNTGKHKWLSPITFTLSCTMNVRDFPFDKQICPLRFGSYTYDISKLILTALPVNLKMYSGKQLISFVENNDLCNKPSLRKNIPFFPLCLS